MRGSARGDHRRGPRCRRCRRTRHVHDGHERGDGDRAQPRHARAVDVHAGPVRRWRVRRSRDASRDGGRDRRRRHRRLLPRVQRTFGQPLRRSERAGHHAAAVVRVVRAVRAHDAGGVGRPARASLHGDVRRDERRLRAHRRGRPLARRDQSRRVVLRAADHPRGPPSVALDRRTRAAIARLLPGERRWRRDRRDLRRTRARPAPDTRGHHRRRAGRDVRRRDDDELLPRRPDRAPRDGRRRPAALGDVRPRARRHVDRVPVRPLHAVRADAARRARLLRAWRGEGLGDRGAAVARRRAADQHRAAASSARRTSTA